MANRQPLSPSGYLINNDPLNTNPFFTFDSGEIDPSILERIQILENDVSLLQDENNTNKQNIADNTEDIRDVDNKFANYYNKDQIDYQFSTYSTQFGQQIQANTNAINSLTDLVGQANALLKTI